MKRALTIYEDVNMYGGAHAVNLKTALIAEKEGRDLMVHAKHYDGQRFHYAKYRVTNLVKDGDTVRGITENGEPWEATAELCEYARTGRI